MLTQTRPQNIDGLFETNLSSGFSKIKSGKWECPLEEMIVGDYLIIPLTSTKMLKSDGYWMNNCCKEYSDRCATGEYALFSIRSRSNERIATLGLVNKSSSWQFDQCYGVGNAEVLEETIVYLSDDGELQSESYPTELYYISHEIVRLMNASSFMMIM